MPGFTPWDAGKERGHTPRPEGTGGSDSSMPRILCAFAALHEVPPHGARTAPPPFEGGASRQHAVRQRGLLLGSVAARQAPDRLETRTHRPSMGAWDGIFTQSRKTRRTETSRHPLHDASCLRGFMCGFFTRRPRSSGQSRDAPATRPAPRTSLPAPRPPLPSPRPSLCPKCRERFLDGHELNWGACSQSFPTS